MSNRAWKRRRSMVWVRQDHRWAHMMYVEPWLMNRLITSLARTGITVQTVSHPSQRNPKLARIRARIVPPPTSPDDYELVN